MAALATGDVPADGDLLAGCGAYRQVRVVNRGAFGTVVLAIHVPSGQQVAVKLTERGKKVSKYAAREIVNHTHLRHPHIVELRDVLLTPRHLGIVMEYAGGGDLYQLVTRTRGLPEGDARWYFQQIVCALDYCHRKGLASRDIKLENTLLDGGDRRLIKLCDFGYSKHEKHQSAPGSRVGTPAYLAPEVVLTAHGGTYDGKAADVWSAGVVLYILLTAAYPFGRHEDDALRTDKRLHAMLQRVLAADWPRAELSTLVSEQCVNVLDRMLTVDPAARATLADVQRHPWFIQDLPPGVADLNDRLLEEQKGSVPTARPGAVMGILEHVQRVLEEAAATPLADPSILDADDSLLTTGSGSPHLSSAPMWSGGPSGGPSAGPSGGSDDAA